MTLDSDDSNTSLASTDNEYNESFLYFYGNDTDGMYEFYAVPQIVFVSILCVFIIVGNCCVLAALRLSQAGRKSRMNLFIMHLALADLLVGVMVSLTDLASKITIEWYAGDAMCKVIQYLQAVVTYASTYMLVSLSIDRYDAVARPMNFSRSGYQGRFLVYMAWLVSFVFALPALFIYTQTVQEGKKQCWVDFPALWHWQLFVTSVTVVTFLIPAVMIASCYIAIIYIIWSKGQGHEPHCSTERIVLHQTGSTASARLTISDRRHEKGRGIIPQAKIRTIKMTLIIVIVFILCWSPYFLYNLLDIYELLPVNNPVTTLIQSAAPLNSAANPIIYGIFSTRICKNLRRIPMPFCVRKLICHCKETKKCRRLVFRASKQAFFASHTTDPTITTNEARHKKRSNQCLHDVRQSPLRTNDRRYASLITKHFLDRAIFTETAGDMIPSPGHQHKRTLFRLSRNKWITEKPILDFEMIPLSKKRLSQLGSSASDESSLTSDSAGRLPASRRLVQLKILSEKTEPATRVCIQKMNTCESILNTSSDISVDKEDDKVDNKVSLKCSYPEDKYVKCDTFDKQQSSGGPCVGHTGETTPDFQVEHFNEGIVLQPQHGSTSLTSQDIEEEYPDKDLHLDADNKVSSSNTSTHSDIPDSMSPTTTTRNRHLQPEEREERARATRRPSGIPSVRRRLTSDENAILDHVARQMLASEEASLGQASAV